MGKHLRLPLYLLYIHFTVRFYDVLFLCAKKKKLRHSTPLKTAIWPLIYILLLLSKIMMISAYNSLPFLAAASLQTCLHGRVRVSRAEPAEALRLVHGEVPQPGLPGAAAGGVQPRGARQDGGGRSTHGARCSMRSHQTLIAFFFFSVFR